LKTRRCVSVVMLLRDRRVAQSAGTRRQYCLWEPLKSYCATRLLGLVGEFDCCCAFVGTKFADTLMKFLTPVRTIRCNGGHLIKEKAAVKPLFFVRTSMLMEKKS